MAKHSTVMAFNLDSLIWSVCNYFRVWNNLKFNSQNEAMEDTIVKLETRWKGVLSRRVATDVTYLFWPWDNGRSFFTIWNSIGDICDSFKSSLMSLNYLVNWLKGIYFLVIYMPNDLLTCTFMTIFYENTNCYFITLIIVCNHSTDWRRK